ncbi:carbohydrate kinase family protein [Kurthia sibirica]|uniref:Fructokinase n=1 Tax=Kurthia sibirica TaxID=202750 RepID=A0A2U3AQB1_9BACL|nr:carbohydrate kinase [Kurthia sibirica]PWI26696.1 fructokinase [Kurthia sibirica]GEK32966.1 aminoimidazole riboside kinase [Kurthia sibirica]
MLESTREFILIYGDAFVDYIANDTTNTSFTTFLGGTTINVAAGISRIGAPSAIITVTGDDDTSKFVRNELANEGVNTHFAKIIPEKRVTGVEVHLTENNDRIFTNYTDETPDIQVETQHLQPVAFEKASVFSFCSNTMFQETALETTKAAVKLAIEHDCLIAMDANIRPLRWESPQQCLETISEFLPFVNIMKLADEELFFITSTTTINEGIAALAHYNITLLMITVGADGTYVVMNGETIHVPSIKINCVDTTGAGDAFMSGILRSIHLNGLPVTAQEAYDYVFFANQLGAYAATKAGAITAMPHLHEIGEIIKPSTK